MTGIGAVLQCGLVEEELLIASLDEPLWGQWIQQRRTQTQNRRLIEKVGEFGSLVQHRSSRAAKQINLPSCQHAEAHWLIGGISRSA